MLSSQKLCKMTVSVVGRNMGESGWKEVEELIQLCMAVVCRISSPRQVDQSSLPWSHLPTYSCLRTLWLRQHRVLSHFLGRALERPRHHRHHSGQHGGELWPGCQVWATQEGHSRTHRHCEEEDWEVSDEADWAAHEEDRGQHWRGGTLVWYTALKFATWRRYVCVRVRTCIYMHVRTWVYVTTYMYTMYCFILLCTVMFHIRN